MGERQGEGEEDEEDEEDKEKEEVEEKRGGKEEGRRQSGLKWKVMSGRQMEHNFLSVCSRSSRIH